MSGGGDSYDGFDADEARMLRSFFRDEANDYLESITRRLLHASQSELDAAAIAEMLRTTHTLKGSAATVGLRTIAQAAHDIEDYFAKLRSHTLEWNARTADHFVEVIDTLRAIVDTDDDEDEVARLVARIGRQLAAIGDGPTPVEVAPTEPVARDSSPPSAPAVDDDDFDDHTPLERPGALPQRDQAVPLMVRDDTEEIVDSRGITGLAASSPVPAASGVVESGSIPMDTTDAARRDEAQVLRIDAARIDRLMNGVGELVFDRTRIERRVADLRRMMRELSKTRQQLHERIESVRDADAELAGTIERIEHDLAANIAHLARATSSLVDDAEALRQTSQSIQDGLTRIRMASIQALFQRLARSLREIARSVGKRVELITAGDDTEFDKLVADQITDPLLQILRNAVAHGLEDEDERVAAGKPPVGLIRMAARQEGDTVWIEVHDDGRGIDPGVLRQQLVERGHWSRDRAATATNADVLRAIFETGVSTRTETDSLAGRGVGLDSVRENIAKLGGDIRVESARGQGTTFTLQLPVTTAVSQALLFKIHGDVYAIPNVHVLETMYIEASSPVIPQHLRCKGEIVPLVVLQSVIGAPPPTDARRVPAVVIDYAGKRLAVTCDRVIGPREIVVKTLGPMLAALPLFAGGTISGSGKVQLLFDSSALVRLAYRDEAPEHGSDRLRAVTVDSRPPGRVLITDDSRAVRETLNRMLTGAGYVVDTATDGVRALEKLRQTRYDALITDLEMPNMGGFELLERIRGDRNLAGLPAIVISSRTSRENRDHARSLGAQSFIPKPVTRRKLITSLVRLLGPDE